MWLRPKGSRILIEYKYIVITSVEGSSDPVRIRTRSFCMFYVGQIVVVDANGGMPIEVGSGNKPGKVGCQCETFDRLIDAIERSYEIWDTGFDHKGEGDRTARPKRKKLRKFRHKA